ncbi:hypothetical protein [Thioalkalivibrio sp. ALJT]|uniref:hypothetical protein n=1 Tax=Thioalkalivibrio sp. ALJT TaxID=1158146 RepID=UPI00036A3BE9|nr:hypothetical protein [Thioalkalivibrio sp. ALJT]
MNLLTATGRFGVWVARVLFVFVWVRPLTTLGLVLSLLTQRVTNLLAFLLPLKIILLAGSDGVPRYFPFIDPSQKMDWIIGLAVAAVVSYILSLIAAAVSEKLAAAGSVDILRDASELATAGDDREKARQRYRDFGDICAASLFVLGGGAVLALINLPLLVFLSALLAVQYLVSVLAAITVTSPVPNVWGRLLRDKLGSWLAVMAAITFLAGFFFLLYPFVWGEGGNLLFAIISVLMLRHILAALSQIATKGVALTQQKLAINALVFRDHQLQENERKERQDLRQLFDKPSREALVAGEFAKLGRPGSVVVRWQDCLARRTGDFHVIRTDPGTGAEEPYQLQVYDRKARSQLEKEDYLFEHLPASVLPAPVTVSRLEVGEFAAQLCTYGEPVTGKDWKRWVESEVYLQLWAVPPPPRLVEVYVRYQPLLAERLTDDLIQRLEVAVDTSDEARCLAQLRMLRGTLCARLMAMPLYVHKQRLRPYDVVVNKAGGYSIMGWGDWSLEPIGAVIPGGMNDKDLAAAVVTLQEVRDDLPAGFGPEHLHLVRGCWDLEQQVKAGKYKAALETAAQLLGNPLIHADDPPVEVMDSNRDRDERGRM